MPGAGGFSLKGGGGASKDAPFFDLLAEAGANLQSVSDLLVRLFETWPEDEGIAREILKAEQEGDRITQAVVKRLNSEKPNSIDSADLYALATQLDDVADDIEEVADFMALYKIEAPMDQGKVLAEILSASCDQLAAALAGLRTGEDLEQRWVEIHRLENEGDRVWREALASLFSDGIDPMVVIRWKDIFGVLERAIDATETAAHHIESIVVQRS